MRLDYLVEKHTDTHIKKSYSLYKIHINRSIYRRNDLKSHDFFEPFYSYILYEGSYSHRGIFRYEHFFAVNMGSIGEKYHITI